MCEGDSLAELQYIFETEFRIYAWKVFQTQVFSLSRLILLQVVVCLLLGGVDVSRLMARHI